MVAWTRAVAVSTITDLSVTCRIQRRNVLANRMGSLFRLGPCDRLVARKPLRLVHICLDQACIDRERFAANKSRRNALHHHTLEHPAQGIARSKTFAPSTTEH